MNKFTEGDARTETHAEACRKHDCMMCCRCWCHGIDCHLNGDPRIDVTEARERVWSEWLRRGR